MESDPIYRVLRALALSRTPGFNFPGYYLGVSFDRMARERSIVSLDNGPHCADPDGQMNLGALALLADMGLATSLRSEVGPAARVATVSMSLQMTGSPRVGRLTAEASFDGFVANGAERQGLTRVEIRSGDALVCTGQGAFMVLGRPDATPPHPLPKRGEMPETTLSHEDLDARELDVLRHAEKSAKARDTRSFLQRFWGYAPRKTKAGATCRAWNGPHIGNRVGHAQGGVSFGLACATASAAVPQTWTLVGASAWYVGPGIGKSLIARSTVLHRGMLTAVVRTRIEDEERRGVLEVVTGHTRLASG